MEFFIKNKTVIISVLILSIFLGGYLLFGESSAYSNYDRVYDSAGLYDRADEYRSVIVNHDDINIENLTTGDMHVTKNVSEGVIHLINVTIESTLKISGAKTVYISNSIIDKLIVDYTNATIIIDKTSEIASVEAKDINKIKLEGTIDTLTVFDKKLNLEVLKSGNIKELYASGKTNNVNAYGTGKINLVGILEKDVLSKDDKIKVLNTIFVDSKFREITYNINFYDENDEIYETEKVSKYTTIDKPKTPIRYGYVFRNWLLDGEIYDFSTEVESDLELYPSWSYVGYKTNTPSDLENNSNKVDKEPDDLYGVGSGIEDDKTIYKVTVIFDNGCENKVYNVSDGDTLEILSNPEKVGYIFKGWYDASDDIFDFTEKITSDITLKAIYEIQTFDVTFINKNDIISKTKVLYNEKVEFLNMEEIAGYVFDGWYIDDEFITEFNFDTAIMDNLILYAKYVKNKNQVKFIVDGVEIANQEVINNGYLEKIKKPVKEGYTFKGWYRDSEFTIKYNLKKEITKDIILYAKFEENDYYTVTFDYDFINKKNPTSIKKTIKLKKGECIESLDISRKRFKLKSWNLNGEVFDFTEKITDNITLKASWDKIKVNKLDI